MIYLFIILLLVFLVYQYDYRRKESGRTFWLITVTAILIIVGGLHYRLGFDTPGYEKFYETLKPLNLLRPKDLEATRFAPGFVVLASFTKLFSPEMVLFNFIEAGFLCGVVSWFFNRNTRNTFFALLLFFFFEYTLLVFEQIREAFCVGIFLLAWPAFRDRKWLIWYALSFCALIFHTSATFMFVLPAVTLPGIRQFLVFGKRTIIICCFVLLLGYAIQAKFSQYIEMIALTEGTQEIASRYEGTDYLKGNFNLGGLFSQVFRMVLYPVLAMCCIGMSRKYNPYIEDLKKKEAFVLLSIYISLFTIFVPIISRFNNYFFFFTIILVSDWVFEVIKLKGKRIRFKFIYWFIFFLPLFGMQLYSGYYVSISKSGKYKGYMVYYPYTSYIDKQKVDEREKIYHVSKR